MGERGFPELVPAEEVLRERLPHRLEALARIPLDLNPGNLFRTPVPPPGHGPRR
jgi:hypothetical protein